MSSPSKAPAIALLAVPFPLSFLLLVVGLVMPSLALVYVSIAASLAALPCAAVGIVLLVRVRPAPQPPAWPT